MSKLAAAYSSSLLQRSDSGKDFEEKNFLFLNMLVKFFSAEIIADFLNKRWGCRAFGESSSRLELQERVCTIWCGFGRSDGGICAPRVSTYDVAGDRVELLRLNC
ncbi:hypothetical protein H6P81_008352 [Aristolochia fimbriata]|uniref:Uncharacterized protein n=1 Tax=Aristolochia fimbriata TaxID=158543 RepID=A0AAV7F7B1_ARIFI|nr:hypothetical protein H6P81_008352 [Aristolochia fimbriata]